MTKQDHDDRSAPEPQEATTLDDDALAGVTGGVALHFDQEMEHGRCTSGVSLPEVWRTK